MLHMRKERKFPHCLAWHNQNRPIEIERRRFQRDSFFSVAFLFLFKFNYFFMQFFNLICKLTSWENLRNKICPHWAWAKTNTDAMLRNFSFCYTSMRLSWAAAVAESGENQFSIFCKVKNFKLLWKIATENENSEKKAHSNATIFSNFGFPFCAEHFSSLRFASVYEWIRWEIMHRSKAAAAANNKKNRVA